MQVTRRNFIAASGAGCAYCCGMRSGFSWPGDRVGASREQSVVVVPTGGCYLLPEELATKRSTTSAFAAQEEMYSTGDPALDRRLGRALVRAARTFAVNPSFGFYDEENAQASPETAIHLPGTWGTVLFGTPLLRIELDRYDPSGMTVLAIIAHEFGHIVQFRRKLREQVLAGQPTVKRLELHADILAGFYLGMRKRESPELSFYTAGEVFHRIGDTNFSSPNHHGTSEERVAASNLGFRHGKEGTADLDQIINIGLEYVMRL